MQYRRLGRTGLQVSLVSLGTGGPSNFGQRSGLTFDEQARLARTAIDLGINFFDTASAYRDSEELLGRALSDVARDRYLLATKCSAFARDEQGGIVASEEIERQCEQSLRRLRTEVIDVYQVHGVVPQRYDEVVERLYPTLQKLRERGKVRFLGISELFFSDASHQMLEKAVPQGLWDSVMLKYGILNQYAARRVLPLCLEHDIGVLDMAAVRVKLTRPAELKALLSEWRGRGLLAPDALLGDDPLGWLVEGSTVSHIAAGYKFAAAHPAITTVLTGTADVEHLRSNTEAILGPPLPPEHEQRLRDLFGELAEGA